MGFSVYERRAIIAKGLELISKTKASQNGIDKTILCICIFYDEEFGSTYEPYSFYHSIITNPNYYVVADDAVEKLNNYLSSILKSDFDTKLLTMYYGLRDGKFMSYADVSKCLKEEFEIAGYSITANYCRERIASRLQFLRKHGAHFPIIMRSSRDFAGHIAKKVDGLKNKALSSVEKLEEMVDDLYNTAGYSEYVDRYSDLSDMLYEVCEERERYPYFRYFAPLHVIPEMEDWEIMMKKEKLLIERVNQLRKEECFQKVLSIDKIYSLNDLCFRTEAHIEILELIDELEYMKEWPVDYSKNAESFLQSFVMPERISDELESRLRDIGEFHFHFLE